MTNDAQPLTITAAAPLIRSGELTPSELLEQCLARVDQYEPKVRAWVHLDRERARREAEQLTAEVKAGNSRGPLHGIPIGVKDIIDVYDMPTGCGSKLWANSYARRDATCVERLRQAGALILGKTVTTAYAYLDPPVTRNPWNLDRTPGGSSSGSAAAVACGTCLAALGSQTGGSTIRPASYCGVYALKPGYHRVSRHGVLPLAPTLDHIGFMANCVRDLALLYEATAGADDYEETWSTGIGPCVDTVDEVRNGRPYLEYAFLTGFFAEKVSTGLAALVAAFRDRLEGSAIERFEVATAVLPPGFAEVHSHHLAIMAVEAAETHADRYKRHPEDYPPRIAQLIEEGLGTPGPVYSRAVRFRTTMESNNNDWAFPGPMVTPGATDFAPDTSTTGDPSFNSPWSFLGYPTISLPIGWSADGLPGAIQLVGGRTSDAELFGHAQWAEQVAGFERRLPPVPG